MSDSLRGIKHYLPSEYAEKHQAKESYHTRNVRPRYLLGIRDSSSAQSEALYQRMVCIWELEKREVKVKKDEEMAQRDMEQAWAALEEEQFRKWEVDLASYARK